ncbi:mycothiol system anti-sigma-R factor [Actinomyces howellii]|uniref:Predicted transmembrane transcriptional regulator (Anti-sigma factor) n=1 Tax=Actinomyces howellii TaxID=52771 RepID=A0A3S4RH47_9ACTO|nr:mycothiol system anti-sigma-R factor [Actinomyces howellii]VEG29960.1 Predicted transmembrane transcriptional regulator (anti-sigma factor) [Actinomyces howellii]
MGSSQRDEPCSCSEARAHLERFLDHECDGDMTARLEAHVATCEHCSRVADAETHLRDILRSRCVEQAPPELRARVLGRLSLLRSVSSVRTTTGSVTVTSVTSVTVTEVTSETVPGTISGTIRRTRD